MGVVKWALKIYGYVVVAGVGLLQRHLSKLCPPSYVLVQSLAKMEGVCCCGLSIVLCSDLFSLLSCNVALELVHANEHYRTECLVVAERLGNTNLIWSPVRRCLFS